MQRFEVTHWFRTYAVEIDDAAGTIKLILPKGERVWNISNLGSFDWYANSTVIDHGNTTENILTGAAIGGKAGAFAAAMAPTGISSHLRKLGFAVCYRGEKQVAFGLTYEFYPENRIERIALPAHRKLEKFVIEATRAANKVIEKKNTVKRRFY